MNNSATWPSRSAATVSARPSTARPVPDWLRNVSSWARALLSSSCCRASSVAWASSAESTGSSRSTRMTWRRRSSGSLDTSSSRARTSPATITASSRWPLAACPTAAASSLALTSQASSAERWKRSADQPPLLTLCTGQPVPCTCCSSPESAPPMTSTWPPSRFALTTRCGGRGGVCTSSGSRSGRWLQPAWPWPGTPGSLTTSGTRPCVPNAATPGTPKSSGALSAAPTASSVPAPSSSAASCSRRSRQRPCRAWASTPRSWSETSRYTERNGPGFSSSERRNDRSTTTSWTGRRSFGSLRGSGRPPAVGRPQDPIQVGIGEAAGRIDLVFCFPEGLELGIQLAQAVLSEGVHLAPVRAAADPGHDRFEQREVGLVRQPAVLVDGDVGAGPPAGGGQPDVVRGRHPHLDREHHRVGQLGYLAPQFGQDLGRGPGRDGVLGLHEADPAPGGEHPVGAVGGGPPRQRGRGDLVQPRDQPGYPAAGPAQQPEAGVLHHLVLVEQAGRPGGGRGLGRGAPRVPVAHGV